MQLAKFNISLLVVMLLLVSCQRKAETKGPEAMDDIEQRIASLVREMTLEEKVGQMTQVTLDVITTGNSPYMSLEPVVLDSQMMAKAFRTYQVGSILNTPNNTARTTAFGTPSLERYKHMHWKTVG